MRNARIAYRTTAVLAEKPGQVRRTILHITSEIVNVEATEIAEYQRAVLSIGARGLLRALLIIPVRTSAGKQGLQHILCLGCT